MSVHLTSPFISQIVWRGCRKLKLATRPHPPSTDRHSRGLSSSRGDTDRTHVRWTGVVMTDEGTSMLCWIYVCMFNVCQPLTSTLGSQFEIAVKCHFIFRVKLRLPGGLLVSFPARPTRRRVVRGSGFARYHYTSSQQLALGATVRMKKRACARDDNSSHFGNVSNQLSSRTAASTGQHTKARRAGGKRDKLRWRSPG